MLARWSGPGAVLSKLLILYLISAAESGCVSGVDSHGSCHHRLKDKLEVLRL